MDESLHPNLNGDAKVHPTAIVEPAAQIGANVVIGPYCMVGEQVVLGENSILESHVVVTGATIPMGASASAAITASTGDVIDLTNWVSGSYNSEIAWDITDPSGAVLAMGVYGGTGPATGNCVAPPACTDNDVTITVGGGSFATEVGWSLVDGSGTVVASASAPTGIFTGFATVSTDPSCGSIKPPC